MCIIKHLSTINFIAEVFPVNNLSDEVSSFCDLPTKLFFILIKNLSLVIFQPTVYVNTFQPSVVHLLFTLTSHYSLLYYLHFLIGYLSQKVLMLSPATLTAFSGRNAVHNDYSE